MAAIAALGLSCLAMPDHAAAFSRSDLAFYPYSGGYYPNAYFFDREPARERPVQKRGSESKPSEPGKTAVTKPAPPSGPLIIAVSIGSQHVTVFDETTPIASAPISTGMPGHPTPTGVFSIIQKQRWHESNIYSGAPMPFMQRITWSGVAMHAGVLPGYPASHGCIRLPESFAVRLYGMTRIGARVVVTRGEVAPYEIDHPLLTALATKPQDAAVNADAKASQASGTGETEPAKAGAGEGTGVSLLGAAQVAIDDTQAVLRPAVDALMPGAAVPLPETKPTAPMMPSGAISLFVSRKTGKLYVRKGFEPLFNVPVGIANSDEPLGTHVFTAGRPAAGGTAIRWLAVSIPERAPEPIKGKGRASLEERPVSSANGLHQAAVEALNRITLPPEVLDRVAPYIVPGASLLISDQGLGEETGKETDFIVVTR
jgi:hypothetical protein